MGARQMFEAHVTVSSLLDERALHGWACERGLSSLCIELDRGATPRQQMVTARYEGGISQALASLETLIRDLRSLTGVEVRRSKLELDLRSVPSELPSHARYLEHHLKVRTQPSGMSMLEELGRAHAGHVSKNAYKSLGAGLEERFLTQRFPLAQRADAERSLNALRTSLEQRGFVVLKSEREVVLHDDNLQLDHGWMKAAV
ncbi:MAG: hypothetical protein QM778_17775 [Myxococcales bacterium]